MTDLFAPDMIFRFILIALYCSFTIIRINFSRQSRKERRKTKSVESSFRLSYLQAFITVTVIIFFLYIFMEEWFAWGAIPNYPVVLQWFGTGVGLAALGIFLYVHAFLGNNFSYTLKIFENHSLITNGPYRFIRHPMYTGFIVFHTAIFLISGNWFIGVLWIGGISIVFLLRIRKEEEMLIEAFGNAYRDYKQRTGMLFPPIFKLLRKSSREMILNAPWLYKAVCNDLLTKSKASEIIQWVNSILAGQEQEVKETWRVERVAIEQLSTIEQYTPKKEGMVIFEQQQASDKAIIGLRYSESDELFVMQFNITDERKGPTRTLTKITASGDKSFVSKIKSNFEQKYSDIHEYQVLHFGP